jgi:hypothetical protein
MKTIIIPVFDGTITKNILRTNVFRRLRSIPDLRIVLIPPKGKEDLYKEEFGSAHVIIEDSALWHQGIWGTFFAGMFLHSIPTNFMRIRQVDWYWHKKKYVHYVGASILRFFGRFSIWRKFLMMLGGVEPISKDVRAAYMKWDPDVIFAPTMIPSLEVSLMRLARQDGKKIVGMAKSWDNLTSKAFLRIFPDLLIVPNEMGVDEAVNIYHFPRERAIPTGISQYDAYAHPEYLQPREEFLASVGLDSKKRTILYAPAGDWMNPNDKETLAMILDWIDEGKIENAQVLLRLHPAYESKTEELAGRKGLVIERPGKHFGSLKTYEFFEDDVRHLASTIAHTDMTISTASTMMVEAAIFDKPDIILGFDGHETLDYWHSVIRYYDREHCVPLVKAGGMRLVKSKDELLSAILSYFADPSQDREGRKKIVELVCYKMDGKAADRTADVLFQALGVSS